LYIFHSSAQFWCGGDLCGLRRPLHILVHLLGLLFFLILMSWPITGFAEGAVDSRLRAKVGAVYRDSQNHLILAIPQSDLGQGTRVVMITVPDQSLVCCATINKVSPVGPETIQHVIFDNAKSTTYDLKMDKEHNDVRFGFGIIDSPGVFSPRAGVVVADLDPDGVRETFRDCTSHEGVHLTIWSGQPLTGSRRWHAYFYLGYETEPSCVERDFE
jgi:hypothetical protein